MIKRLWKRLFGPTFEIQARVYRAADDKWYDLGTISKGKTQWKVRSGHSPD